MSKAVQGPMDKVTQTYNTLYTGTLGGNNNVAQLAGDSYEVFSVLVQADPDNPDDCWIGNDLAQYVELEAGSSITIPIDDLRKLYIRFGNGANYVHFLAVG